MRADDVAGSPASAHSGFASGGRRSVPDLLSDHEWRQLLCGLGLSSREGEFLRHAFDDPRDEVIAGRMGITAHGAHAHRIHLFRKLGVDGMARALAVVCAACIAARQEGNGALATDNAPVDLHSRSMEATGRRPYAD